MPCNCQPLQPPPPFDVPPPPDPSLVFHLLSEEPPETFEKLHLLYSCPLQKHHFFFRPPLDRFVPLAVIAALLLFTSLSITTFIWRKRRRTVDGMGEESDGREWRRKSEEKKSGRRQQMEEGRKKQRKTQSKRRLSALSGNTPPNGVPPPSSAVRLQPHFNLHLSAVSSPSSDPDANSSCRSSTETVSSVPSLPPIGANEWTFCHHQHPTAVAECDTKGGSNVFHRVPFSAAAFATPPRRSIALRLLQNQHPSPDFVWRSSADCAQSCDLYEELAVTDGEIAEAPYKWRRTLTPSASVRRLPPPSSKPPPPPTDCPADWPVSAVAIFSTNRDSSVELNGRQTQQAMTTTAETNDDNNSRSRWRTSSDLLDRERESGYGTGRSGRRERSQHNGRNEESDRRNRCLSAHPSSSSALPNVLSQSQNNGSSTGRKIRQISAISKLADGMERLSNCGEKRQTKTMTYL